jgi:hypothetical protein
MYSLAKKPRGSDKSECRDNTSERRALTRCRAQGERQVRTRKQTERVRGTHFLKSADKGSSQERSRPSERRALTSWRAQTRRRAKSGCRYKTTPARGTHFLESADQTEGEVRTQIQNHACEGYSLSGESGEHRRREHVKARK